MQLGDENVRCHLMRLEFSKFLEIVPRGELVNGFLQIVLGHEVGTQRKLLAICATRQLMGPLLRVVAILVEALAVEGRLIFPQSGQRSRDARVDFKRDALSLARD